MNRVAVIGIVGNSVFLPVEKFHTGGETVEASDVRFEYGGKGFNQAVAAARWSAEVSFLAAVGSDAFIGIKSFLEKESIKPLLVKKDSPTAFAAIITDKSGANRVTVYQGAQLSSTDVALFSEQIANADVLVITNETTENVNIEAVKIAVANGVKIILNPAPYKETSEYILQNVTLFTPNEFEAEGLENYENVIQTLGKAGCLIKSSNIVIPPTDDIAVDTTGAGDTFNGVLAAELSVGRALNKAVESAVKASGYSVTKKGAVSSIPRKNDIV